MKRSNIIFIALLVALFVLPFIILGGFYIKPSKQYLTGFDESFNVVMIENPSLGADDIEIGSPKSSSFSGLKINTKELWGNQSYIYYEGKKTYLPVIHNSNDTLFIGKPEKDAKEKLTLKIQLANLKKINLNGTEILKLRE
jgi:hypothetical protein